MPSHDPTKPKHASMERVFQAAASLSPPLTTPTEIAAWLGTYEQMVTNWLRRGISQKGAVDAQARTGLNANWILTGNGEPWGKVPTQVELLPPAVVVETSGKTIAEEAVRLLAEVLDHMDEDGREMVAPLLARFAKNHHDIDRTTKMLEAAMSKPIQPPTPPDKRKKTPAAEKSAPARKQRGMVVLEVKPGGGQKRLVELPIKPLRAVIRNESAPPSELKWYEHLKTVPKANKGER